MVVSTVCSWFVKTHVSLSEQANLRTRNKRCHAVYYRALIERFRIFGTTSTLFSGDNMSMQAFWARAGKEAATKSVSYVVLCKKTTKDILDKDHCARS
jgi:hypothetical protein